VADVERGGAVAQCVPVDVEALGLGGEGEIEEVREEACI